MCAYHLPPGWASRWPEGPYRGPPFNVLVKCITAPLHPCSFKAQTSKQAIGLIGGLCRTQDPTLFDPGNHNHQSIFEITVDNDFEIFTGFTEGQFFIFAHQVDGDDAIDVVIPDEDVQINVRDHIEFIECRWDMPFFVPRAGSMTFDVYSDICDAALQQKTRRLMRPVSQRLADLGLR